jgi:transmembrane 9 superfamily protein 2/4
LVNELFSEKTQLPFEYYYLKFCVPDYLENSEENLGAMILGEKTENSAYKVTFKKNSNY